MTVFIAMMTFNVINVMLIFTAMNWIIDCEDRIEELENQLFEKDTFEDC